MDVTSLCRGCMKIVASREREKFTTRAVEMFSFCTNLRVTEDDNLPQQFCSECIIKMESSYTFITEAQKVHVTLKNIISRSDTSVIVEPCTKTDYPEPEIKLTLPDYKICSVVEDTKLNQPAEKKMAKPVQLENSESFEYLEDNEPIQEIELKIERLTEELKITNYCHICQVCWKSFASKALFAHHMETEHTEDYARWIEEDQKITKKRYICQLCSKRFTSKAWFAKHMQNDHTKDYAHWVKDEKKFTKKKYVCDICRKVFKSEAWFEKHMKRHKKKFPCPYCPKTFSRSSLLSSHSMSHSEERKFACSTCGKRFKRRRQLSAHMLTHGNARPFACDQCTARFKTKTVLQCHMLVHKDKAYLCYVCGWSFAQAGNLNVHMRMHTGEKPFTCSVCSYRSGCSSGLRSHQRTHAPPRQLSCVRCGKLFNDTSNLARHMRTHTGALPYKCPACVGAFSDSWKRKVHLMRTHRIPLQEIPRMRKDGRIVQ